MARPPDGLKHVDRLDGPKDLNRRLRLILATVTGELTIEQACAELGIERARLQVLRKRALYGARDALAPGQPGRPPKPPPAAETSRVAALEAQLKELEGQLIAARVREEIALTMPHLLVREKKEGTSRGSWKKKR